MRYVIASDVNYSSHMQWSSANAVELLNVAIVLIHLGLLFMVFIASPDLKLVQ